MEIWPVQDWMFGLRNTNIFQRTHQSETYVGDFYRTSVLGEKKKKKGFTYTFFANLKKKLKFILLL